ncbi:MAG: general secretion pathway protein K [Hyphomicrobiaceae bacterium]
MNREQSKDAPSAERGVALVIALMSMALLTVLVLEFTTTMQVELRRTDSWLAGRRARSLAEAGVKLAAQLLELDARLSGSDTLKEPWATVLPPLATEAGTIFIRIEDEQRRLNLNRLASGVRSTDGQRFRRVLAELEIGEELAAGVADWIDRNDSVTASPPGAEVLWYAELDPPYVPRNSGLRSFAELALIKGFNPAALRALRPVTSVTGGSTSTVNINTVSPELLRLMDPRLDDDVVVASIVDRRKSAALANEDDLKAIEPLSSRLSVPRLRQLFRYSSDDFRVRATGESGGITRSVEAVLHREHGRVRITYWLARNGPNIVGADIAVSDSPAPFDLVAGTTNTGPR